MKEKYSKEIIKLAKIAYKKGEVPVGAIITKNDKILARAYNKIETSKDATMHAEILAIKKASKKLKNWRLNDCEMYVTLEPCTMCSSAIELSRIKKVYYLVKRDKEISIKKSKYIHYNTFTTEALNLLTSVLDIEFIDHLILGKDEFYSFAQNALSKYKFN